MEIMKKMKQEIRIVAVAAALMTGGCDSLDIKGMFFSSGDPTEERVAEWLAWDEAHGPNVIADVPDEYRFYACSDPHVDTSAARVAEFLRQECQDPRAVMSIIMGDIANKAGEEPYRMVLDAIRNRPAAAGQDTCWVILGNHDIYFDCNTHYRNCFHTSTYTLEVQTAGGYKDLYVFLDSGNSTHGARQMGWLREVLSRRSEYRHCIICTHVCIFRTTYNYSTTPAANLPLEEYYELTDLMAESNVSLFMMGHFHYKESQVIGGIPYVMTDNLNDTESGPSCLVVDCGNDGVNYKYQNL